ncbi:L-idonate 5-dehydrogenase [Thalassospira sp. TSL5-1]|uniref:L-idonate 5-dehydrogenase n=1 Tax=Thalassospira sp. TSL5-1 TaxID=1544451 RepID=UPI000938C4C7|nr:L-idonate 5-dehydrogenase [Thalassospira sp. TSL5-1]OKH86804.1 phosphoesterase [Thalassospira sp. TSL5-1]
METRVCRLYGQQDVRIETDNVAPLSSGQVTVRIGAGGICGSDIHYFYEGGIGQIRVREPIILGHEVAGTVIAVSDDVNNVSIGQKVALNPSHPCGECEYCKKNLQQHCLDMRFFGSAIRLPHVQGAFRDVMTVNAAQCVPVSEQTSLAQAACAEPLAVCLHAVNRAGDLSGKRVLVTGAGPIGALCVAAAKQAGAAEIIVTDLQDYALDIALQMGADKAVNIARHATDLAQYEEGKGQIDVCFECSAAAPAIGSAIKMLRPQGILVQVGVAGDIPVSFNPVVAKELMIVGTHRFHEEYAQAVHAINSGKINVKPIITTSFELDDAVAAFDMARDRSKAVKVHFAFAS